MKSRELADRLAACGGVARHHGQSGWAVDFLAVTDAITALVIVALEIASQRPPDVPEGAIPRAEAEILLVRLDFSSPPYGTLV